TDDVDNRDQVVRAISKLGVKPTTNVATAPSTWDAVKGTRDVDVLLDWLEQNPTHEKRQEAFTRVRSLVDAADGEVKETPGRIVRTSKWSAFFSGFTFRLPSFQLSTQGKWSSIGFSIALVLLMVLATILAVSLVDPLDRALRASGWAAVETI